MARPKDWKTALLLGASRAATFLIIAMILLILAEILWRGLPQVSPRFVFGGTSEGMFEPAKAGVFPMIFGTLVLVVLMTLGVVPVGVITAIYLTEYAKASSPWSRIIRGAINNLAGVPSI
ncbi:MAG: phosphate ABC transporter, permease protein PstA, partial [Verrucomicrobiae bacterium]|nr:phosphate ABC transporter, permease protein PstA [Verrucomicrobiae bacterium]